MNKQVPGEIGPEMAGARVGRLDPDAGKITVDLACFYLTSEKFLFMRFLM